MQKLPRTLTWHACVMHHAACTQGWKDCGTLAELFGEKQSKVVELAAGKAIMLYSYKDKVYCTDAFSTAYQVR